MVETLTFRSRPFAAQRDQMLMVDYSAQVRKAKLATALHPDSSGHLSLPGIYSSGGD